MRDSYEGFLPKERGLFGDNEQRPERAHRPRVAGASDLVDLDLILHNDNPQKLAIAVSMKGSTPFADWKWLPHSLIEYEKTGTGADGSQLVRVTMPERVAIEKGLI